jgi:hypothetical protein
MAAKLNGLVEFRSWNWWIGTGFFNDDTDAQYWTVVKRSNGRRRPPASRSSWLPDQAVTSALAPRNPWPAPARPGLSGR